MYYLSANGYTKVLVEMYMLNEDGHNVMEEVEEMISCEQMYRVKVESGEFWVTVHSKQSKSRIGEEIEVTMGVLYGTTVAVTVHHIGGGDGDDGSGFQVISRTIDGKVVDDRLQQYTWPDGRMVFDYHGQVFEVIASDDSRVIIDFENSECEVLVSDGMQIRTWADPTIEYCQLKQNKNTKHPDRHQTFDKYLICRRDLSGYEFVDGLDVLDRPTTACHTEILSPDNIMTPFGSSNNRTPPPFKIVRTLTRSHFNHDTIDSMDRMLAKYFKSIKTTAERLNIEFPENAKPETENID